MDKTAEEILPHLKIIKKLKRRTISSFPVIWNSPVPSPEASEPDEA